MIPQVYLRILAHFSFNLFTLKSRINQFLRIRIRKEHTKYSVEKFVDFNSNDVAILALYPGRHNIPSTLRIITFLQEKNFNVLVVVNRNTETESFISLINKLQVTIISRPNIGRDFGAYQIGTKFILDMNLPRNGRHFHYINDSIIFSPKFMNSLSKFLGLDDPWKTLFLNMQWHVHAQSFFLSFSSDIFYLNEIRNFWEKYYPSNFRRDAINKGEVQLSQILIGLDFQPKVFANFKLIGELLKSNTMNFEEQFKVFQNSQIASDIVSKMVWGNSKIESNLTRSKLAEFLSYRIQEILVSANPTHLLGPYLTRVCYLPLKLDLIRHSAISPVGFCNSLVSSGVKLEEAQFIVEFLMSKGSPVSLKGIRRIWDRYGLI
jgi:hypothetical protein